MSRGPRITFSGLGVLILVFLVGVGSASCATFKSEAPHTTITGFQNETLTLGIDPGTVTCTKASFSATVEGASFGGFTATPLHESCALKTEFGNIGVSVNLNGCDYRFTAAGGFEIQCPAGKSIVISGPGCTVTLPGQSANGLEYIETGEGSSRDLDISFNLSNLDYSYSGIVCGSGAGTENGTLKGAMTALGECGVVQIGLWVKGEAEGNGCPTFHSEVEHTTITGSQTTTLALATDAGTAHCKKATFTATAESSSFESITAAPAQSECLFTNIFGTISTATNFNGCDYVFGAIQSFQIKCPEGKSITISGPGCTITVPAQSLASGITYENTGEGASRDLDIVFNLSGLAYSYSGFTCGSGSGTKNGTLKGVMTALGECPSGAPVGVKVGGEEESGKCPSFNSEAPHTTITGSQTTTLTLGTDAGIAHCKKATFTATAEASSSEFLTAAPAQAGCTLTSIFGNIAATINFNGCDYVFGVYGGFQIDCPEGKEVVISGPGCTVKVSAQTLASGITYANTGESASRDIDITFNPSGLAYSYSGFTCGSGSGTKNGTLKGVMTAVGECSGGGGPIGLWTGEGEEGKAVCPTNFHSEATQITISGAQIETLAWNLDPGTVSCETATFQSSSGTATFGAFTVFPVYEGCALKHSGGSVGVLLNFNGCDYVFGAVGSFQILCPSGKSISIAGLNCSITIPSQSLTNAITYANTGSGSSRDLDITFNLSGLAYSYSGSTCGSSSGTANGTYAGTATLQGKDGGGVPVGIWR